MGNGAMNGTAGRTLVQGSPGTISVITRTEEMTGPVEITGLGDIRRTEVHFTGTGVMIGTEEKTETPAYTETGEMAGTSAITKKSGGSLFEILKRSCVMTGTGAITETGEITLARTGMGVIKTEAHGMTGRSVIKTAVAQARARRNSNIESTIRKAKAQEMAGKGAVRKFLPNVTNFLYRDNLASVIFQDRPQCPRALLNNCWYKNCKTKINWFRHLSCTHCGLRFCMTHKSRSSHECPQLTPVLKMHRNRNAKRPDRKRKSI